MDYVWPWRWCYSGLATSIIYMVTYCNTLAASSGTLYPANTRRSPNVGTMLGQRRRRWTNIVPTLGECFCGQDMINRSIYFTEDTRNIQLTMDQCLPATSALRERWPSTWFQGGLSSKLWPIVESILVQHLRRWPSFGSMSRVFVGWLLSEDYVLRVEFLQSLRWHAVRVMCNTCWQRRETPGVLNSQLTPNKLRIRWTFSRRNDPYNKLTRPLLHSFSAWR